MIIENSEVWSKAIAGEPLTDEEDMICELISHTYFFTIGQLCEQAVHLNDNELIASRLSLPNRLKNNYSPVKTIGFKLGPNSFQKAMDHWLNLLIELLLIHSFRVRCPKGSKFFSGGS